MTPLLCFLVITNTCDKESSTLLTVLYLCLQQWQQWRGVVFKLAGMETWEATESTAVVIIYTRVTKSQIHFLRCSTHMSYKTFSNDNNEEGVVFMLAGMETGEVAESIAVVIICTRVTMSQTHFLWCSVHVPYLTCSNDNNWRGRAGGHTCWDEPLNLLLWL